MSDSDRDDAERAPDLDAAPEGRRVFLEIAVGAVGAGVACIVVAPAVAALAFPLEGEVANGGASDGASFVAIGRRDRFGPDRPVRVDVFADVVDGWNRLQNVRLGAVWVIERDGELVAFSTVCPHLGCSIDFDDVDLKFRCPCHRSAFALDGAHEDGPSPRALDRLDIRDEAGVVSVLYQRFRQGIEAKETL